MSEPEAQDAPANDGQDAEADAPPRTKLETSEGELVIELWPEVAPKTVQNFQDLIHQGFYNGLTFHRIIPAFMVQGGCPIGDGTGNPGWHVDAEFNNREHEKGVVSMARTQDPNSAGSQFFICLTRENCRHLDGQYTAFGKVVEGMDTLDRIGETALANPELGTPVDPPHIYHAYDPEDDHHDYHHDDYHHDDPDADSDADADADASADTEHDNPTG